MRFPLRAIIVVLERSCLSPGHQHEPCLRGFAVSRHTFEFVFCTPSWTSLAVWRIRRDRGIRPQSWKARCSTPILFTRVCVCLSSDNLRTLPQARRSLSKKKRHCVIVIPFPLTPIAHTLHIIFSSVVEPLLLVLIAHVARQACPLQATTEPTRFERLSFSLRGAMFSSAVSSVRYRDAAGGHSETRLGSYVYGGW